MTLEEDPLLTLDYHPKGWELRTGRHLCRSPGHFQVRSSGLMTWLSMFSSFVSNCRKARECHQSVPGVRGKNSSKGRFRASGVPLLLHFRQISPVSERQTLH